MEILVGARSMRWFVSVYRVITLKYALNIQEYFQKIAEKIKNYTLASVLMQSYSNIEGQCFIKRGGTCK